MVSELVRKSVAMKIQHESQTGSLAYFRYLVTGQFKLARSSGELSQRQLSDLNEVWNILNILQLLQSRWPKPPKGGLYELLSKGHLERFVPSTLYPL